MKKKVFIAILLFCVLLTGCFNNDNDSQKPDSEANLKLKTAVLYTNMKTGSADPDIKEHKYKYSGELTAEDLAAGLSNLTGLDFFITASKDEKGIHIDWAPNSTLMANLDDREQKKDFFCFDADSMRWFMMDSLWLTLTKNLEVENVYYTMNGGKDLLFENLYLIKEFPADLPYMGSAFFYAHADGRGDIIDEKSNVNDSPLSQTDAEELVLQTLTKQKKEGLSLVGGGEDTINGENAIIVIAGKKSADGKNFTELYHFAVTDSGKVYYMDAVQGSDWIMDKK